MEVGMKKRNLLIGGLVVLIPLVLWAGAVILQFTAEVQSNTVVLSWRTGVEVNLSEFQVQRSTTGTTFYSIGSVEPNGSYSEYQYVDDNLLKQSVRTYYYRLKIVDNDGTSTYSVVREVTIISSGIQQTWGSIKAMFR
jgi:hypothetical protein